MDIEKWLNSKVCLSNESVGFLLEENELPIFIIESTEAKTMITTRRIIEKTCRDPHCVKFEEIDDVIFGDFKGQITKPILSTFRIIDTYGHV